VIFKYLILAVLLTSASHSKALSISGNYKEFSGVQSYNYAINYGIINYDYIKSSKYFYEAVEINYTYNKWLGYARLAEHSKSANKTEQTISVGYQFIDACNVSVGHREDITGSSLLLRPTCGYKLDNLGIKAAYIYTDNSNIYTLKVKYEVTGVIFIKYKLLKFDADDAVYSYTANAISFGVNF
tara:strand:- start:174 stop:725 length:552 start_codon:yes stop_codon:yes gene_type:complete